MKIAEVVASFYPKIGGGANAVRFLSAELVKLGNEVHVITSTRGKEEDSLNIYVHRTKVIRPSLIKEFDVIHIHSIKPICLQALLMSKHLAKPTVISLLSVGGFMEHPNLVKRALGGLYEWAALKFVKYADIIHVKNQRDKEKLIKFGFSDRKICLIPDGIPDYALKRFDGEAFRRKYNLVDNKIVLYVGRLHYPKGVHVLVRAMPKVIKHVPNAVAVLVGPDAGMRNKLLSIIESLGISDHVVLTGYVSEEEKFQAYSACDVFVLPSLYDLVEAYSIVISEAHAQGKPIIAASVGAIPYRIRHMVNGLLVPPNNVNALAEAIIRVLSTPNLAKHLGENGRRCVYTWREVALRVQSMYQTVLRTYLS